MMHAEPQPEHRWLQKLVGNWSFEVEAPSEAAGKLKGAETVSSLGGLWIVAEGQGEMPGGGAAQTLLTIGYDTEKKRFVGTWQGSMMTNLWVYEGSLDETGKTLTLNTEGPHCSVEGATAKYREAIQFNSDDERTFTSSMLGEDGNWQQIMTAKYRRIR
jgi:hypothetical protein